MILGIDAREIQNGVITGIGRSLVNFINYFMKNDKKHKLILFSEKKIPLRLNNNTYGAVLRALPAPFWDQWRLPRALSAHKINLFYSPYYKIPLFTKIPIVNQILDLMYIAFRPYYDELKFHRKLYYSTFGKIFAHKSINIISDSEHAKKDIIQIWNINPKKIIVIPLGLANRYKPVNDSKILNDVKNRFGLPEKFLLYLGNFKLHKNVISLIKAFKKIEEKFPEYNLVLAGPLDNNGNKIKKIVKIEGIEKKVVFTDTIKEEYYPEALLSLADVFVFPTLYEGFGLPPLEAMACGTPVVASNLTSIPEVIGDAGLLVNPLDIDEMSKKISELLNNPEKRSHYSKRGLKRAERFREMETSGRLYQYIISLLEEIR